ncbi:hypothetical protein GDO78_013080 [Eleutherodactylus coqui]|uniref:Uncharacterized protein n=1 Tax=Eleutherodactylus coqui TaxID=57060 RepID=A0A8J6EZP2_ELECQ|nr:hypothetical protein GDO78_013080 [Eleutherodactylus coqui]
MTQSKRHNLLIWVIRPAFGVVAIILSEVLHVCTLD